MAPGKNTSPAPEAVADAAPAADATAAAAEAANANTRDRFKSVAGKRVNTVLGNLAAMHSLRRYRQHITDADREAMFSAIRAETDRAEAALSTEESAAEGFALAD